MSSVKKWCLEAAIVVIATCWDIEIRTPRIFLRRMELAMYVLDYVIDDFENYVLSKEWRLETVVFVIARCWDIEILIPRILLRRMELVVYFLDYAIVDFEKYVFCKKRVSGNRHRCHSHMLWYGSWVG